MDKLKEERNWTGRRDSRLVKNLLIKRRHDYAPKKSSNLNPAPSNHHPQTLPHLPHQVRQKNARHPGRP